MTGFSEDDYDEVVEVISFFFISREKVLVATGNVGEVEIAYVTIMVMVRRRFRWNIGLRTEPCG